MPSDAALVQRLAAGKRADVLFLRCLFGRDSARACFLSRARLFSSEALWRRAPGPPPGPPAQIFTRFLVRDDDGRFSF